MKKQQRNSLSKTFLIFSFQQFVAKIRVPKSRKNLFSHVWHFYTAFVLKFCPEILIYIQKVLKYEKPQMSISKTCFIFSVGRQDMALPILG